MTSWECPNCAHGPANVRDTQLYLPKNIIAGGYESDSSWDLNPDSETDTKDDFDMTPESDDDTSAPVVVRRKPKVNSKDATVISGGSQMSFVDVGRQFATILKSAHMPM